MLYGAAVLAIKTGLIPRAIEKARAQYHSRMYSLLSIFGAENRKLNAVRVVCCPLMLGMSRILRYKRRVVP